MFDQNFMLISFLMSDLAKNHNGGVYRPTNSAVGGGSVAGC